MAQYTAPVYAAYEGRPTKTSNPRKWQYLSMPRWQLILKLSDKNFEAVMAKQSKQAVVNTLETNKLQKVTEKIKEEMHQEVLQSKLSDSINKSNIQRYIYTHRSTFMTIFFNSTISNAHKI